MIEIKNLKMKENIAFEDYLLLPGLSFSSIKKQENGNAEIITTNKMNFGSLVDAYLLEPNKYTGENFAAVKACAVAAKKYLGILLENGKKQLSITCNMQFSGMRIKYKGRVDIFAAQTVIDMKVSELDILKSVNYFHYHNQLSGYALALNCNKSLLFSVHPKKHTVQMISIPTKSDWWEQMILKYGEPV